MASYSGQEFSGSLFPERRYDAEYRDTFGSDCSPRYSGSGPRLPSSGYTEAYGECVFYGPSGSGRDANLGVQNFSSSSGIEVEQQMPSSSFYLGSQREGRPPATNDDDFRDRRQYSPTFRSSLPTERATNFVDQWHSDYVPYNANSIGDDARSVSANVDRDFRESHRMRPSPGRESTVYDNRRSRDTRLSRSPRHHDKYSSKSSDYAHADGVSRHDEKSSRSKDERYSEERSERKSKYSKSSDHGYSDDKYHDRHSYERKTYREDQGCGDDQGKSERRSKRRSRSRDRDRDRRYRDSGHDRRHRDSDRDRHRRERDHDRIRSRSPKETPWVPPPLPEHLRSLTTVPWVPPPRLPKQQHYSASTPWGPTSVQRAAPARPALQNQFQNDGSFIELFRQQMQAANSVPQSGDSNSGDATECSETPAVATVAAASVTVSSSATAPTLAATSCGLPVIAKRRISKILKTGVVQKPKKEAADVGPEAKGSDAWSRYMSEVQKYRANKCIEDEASRPLMK